MPVWPPGHGKLVSGRRLGLGPGRVSIGKWAISIMVDGLRALSLSRYEQPLIGWPLPSNRALSLLQLLLCDISLPFIAGWLTVKFSQFPPDSMAPAHRSYR